MSDKDFETMETMSEDAARAAALEVRIAELEVSTQARILSAELKAAALRAGMIDLDGLKLVDTSSVTLNEKGELVGAAALMSATRRAKPWLFGPASSSSSAAVPPAQAPRAKSASEMSHDEWQAGRKELIRRR